MQILFAISLLCFVGILWAALALARRIKAAILRTTQIPTAQPDFKHHFEAAAHSIPEPIFSTGIEPAHIPAPVHTEAPTFIPPRHDRGLSLRPNPIPNSSNPATPLSIAPPVDRKSRQGTLHQSARDIAANKDWALPRQPVHMEKLSLQRVESRRKSTAPPRKPPQPARHGPVELLDPAYFNKDLGDLNDPYQPPPRLRVNDRRQ